MPAGVQIVGRSWCDHEVLAVAKVIEQTAGGFVVPELRLCGMIRQAGEGS